MVGTPPLCVIQARYHSTRLPGKMLLPLGDTTVIGHAWRTACQVFGKGNVVLAIPASDRDGPFRQAFCDIDAVAFWWAGGERDVLGRLHACAHAFRGDNPDAIIARVTPDDVPIDATREMFPLAWLDEMHVTVTNPHLREHVGLLLPLRIEINTADDYEAAKAIVEGTA